MLKKIFAFLLFIPVFSFAQNFRSTLIFSAEQGDAFFVYLNGQKQNAAAQANVTIHGLELPYYDVRIEFLNATINPIEKKNVTAVDSDDRPMQVTYKVRKDKSGKGRMSFYGMLPAVSSPVNTPLPAEMKSEPTISATDPVIQKTILSNVSGATVSIPESKAEATKADSNSIPAPLATESKKEPVATAKPVKKSEIAPKSPIKGDAPKKDAKASIETPKTGTTPALPPLRKCNDWPLMKEEFLKIKQQVVDAKDEPAKLAKAKTLSAANCLLVSQVAELAIQFSTDAKKLEFVTYAYSATIDRPNFDRLAKLFSDASSIKNFEKFLQSRK